MIQPTNMQNPYPQQGGANAVSINIFNPQAYGAGATPMPQQTMPYTYQNPIYDMQQASVYAQPQMSPANYQAYIPNQQIIQQPVMPQAPAPQEMPVSVLNSAPQVVEQPAQQVEIQPAQANNQVEIVDSQQAPETTVNVDELVQNLKSTDANVKSDTINQIASYAQEAPEIALQVVSEPVMQGLVDVIKEDTTGLEGPTAEQVAVAEKIAKGEQLTPEEDKLSEQLSPRDMANKNRIFALYTLAMIQKLQRDELNQYIENQKANGEQPIPALKVEDLVGYNDVVNVIKNDSRPEVQVAAIQALQHVVEPEDKATVETVLADALNSQDEAIKTAANDAMAKFPAAAGTVQG